MKVLVTGGAGFVGANLVRALETDEVGFETVVIDDLSTGLERNLKGTETRLVHGSILNETTLAEALEGCSAVVHLAARASVPRSIEDPQATHLANSTGTMMVLEAARNVGDVHVVVASSSSVYGATEALPKHEELPVRPISPYAASKLSAESYSVAWAQSFDLPVLVFRFFNIYGPLQAPRHVYAAAVPAFLAAAFQNRKIPINGDGQQTRDFTYVDTAVRVLVDALKRRVTHPHAVNLAFGTQTTLLDLVRELESIFGRRLQVDFRETRVGDVTHSRADPTWLRSLFPAIRPTELAEGLRITADWFQEERPWENPDYT